MGLLITAPEAYILQLQNHNKYVININMSNRKPLIILSGEIKTPPFSSEARIEAGTLLGLLQEGGTPSMPHARPMPDIGTRCLELRVKDKSADWRIFCRADSDAIVMIHVLKKKTEKTPKSIIDLCNERLKNYDRIMKG
jgi:phage-related protein